MEVLVGLKSQVSLSKKKKVSRLNYRIFLYQNKKKGGKILITNMKGPNTEGLVGLTRTLSLTQSKTRKKGKSNILKNKLTSPNA